MSKKFLRKKKGYVLVKIHGIYDVTQNKIIKASIDKSEIDMELVLIEKKSNLRECVMDIALSLDGLKI